MPNNFGSVVVKLLIASFVVGLLLTLFDITPLDLLENLTGTIAEIYAHALDFVRWGAEYVLVGAVVVVPVWAVVAALNYVQRKSRKRPTMTNNEKKERE